MNQIFPDKMAKSDVVTQYEQRQSLHTKLEPAGKKANKQNIFAGEVQDILRKEREIESTK